jgi:hypothetical protein
VGGKNNVRVPRIIPLPKIGGVLPLLPAIFAGLSALGGLTGGATSIYRAIKNGEEAKRQLQEAERHNKTMEAIAIGKNKEGSGIYLKPYRKGLGLYIAKRNNFSKNY